MSLSNEEISTGNIDLFEHVANPEDKLDFSVTWRLLDFVPLIEQTLLDHLIELLEEKNLFRNQVKGSLKRASQLVDQACTQAYMSMGFDRKQSSEQFDGNMQFALEMTEKMTSCMLEYMGRIESITNVSGFLTEEKRTNYILDNAILLCKLRPGDTFFFLDQSQATEYTYVKTTIRKDDVVATYKKVTLDQEFSEDNPYRPVIKTNFLNEDTLKSLEAYWKRVEKIMSKPKPEVKK